MPKINRSALVSYSAQAMFDLVNDVDAYPEFLPGCADVKVISKTEQAMSASLLVSKAGIKQWFTTNNTLVSGKSIQMTLAEGPFRNLSGGWTFSSLTDSACKIELNLDFEFDSKLIELAFGKIFSSITMNMVSAFSQRAKVVYG